MPEVNQMQPAPGKQGNGELPDTTSAAVLSNERVAIRGLFDSLERKDARYCHWKSNVRLDGTLAGAEDIDLLVDPLAPANARIVDLEHAARDAEGLVHFWADFCLLQPAEAERGSGRLLFEVANRGRKLAARAYEHLGIPFVEKLNGDSGPEQARLW